MVYECDIQPGAGPRCYFHQKVKDGLITLVEEQIEEVV
jgi:hypothetical protein